MLWNTVADLANFSASSYNGAWLSLQLIRTGPSLSSLKRVHEAQKTPLIHYHTSTHKYTIHTKLHTLRLVFVLPPRLSVWTQLSGSMGRGLRSCRMADSAISVAIGASAPVCHKACPDSLPKAGGLTQAGPDVRKGSRGALVRCANAFQYGQTSVPSAGAQPAPLLICPFPHFNPSTSFFPFISLHSFTNLKGRMYPVHFCYTSLC